MTTRVNRLSLSYQRTNLQQKCSFLREEKRAENEIYNEKNRPKPKLIQPIIESFYQTTDNNTESHNGKQRDFLKIKSTEELKKRLTLDVEKSESSSSRTFSTEFKKEKFGFLCVEDDFGRFPCLWCKKSFATEYNLRRHNLKHREEKNKQIFRCQECWQKFDRKDMLNRHLLTHREERPHVCDICRRRFKHNYHLNAHIKFDRCFKKDKIKYY